jgi:hypothetical protein
MGVQVALGSITFTGIIGENDKNKKYSLKNLSSLTHHSLSLSSFKFGLQFKGSNTLNQKTTTTGFESNSMLRYDRGGNTTYIMPYKFKVKVPKFKTPSLTNN